MHSHLIDYGICFAEIAYKLVNIKNKLRSQRSVENIVNLRISHDDGKCIGAKEPLLSVSHSTVTF